MDMYHIQLSVYVKADTIHGAKAAAQIAKSAIEQKDLKSHPIGQTWLALDEVIIDSVKKEKEYSSDATITSRLKKSGSERVPRK